LLTIILTERKLKRMLWVWLGIKKEYIWLEKWMMFTIHINKLALI
jgi:hypothetical protein